MITVFFIVFGLLGIGLVMVIYGTVAKNRWGINVDPVSCPLCKTRIPQIRQPRNLRQKMWGGGDCPACGVEVDKWGRQLASPVLPLLPRSVEPSRPWREVIRKRFIYAAPVLFLLILTLDFVEIALSKGSLPLTISGWLGLIAAAAVETAIFAVLSYFATIYFLKRFVHLNR